MRGLLLTVLAVFWAVILVLTGGRFLPCWPAPTRTSWCRSSTTGQFWVEPFFNMFGLDNKAVEDTGGVFEPASLLAFVVYLVLGSIVLTLVSGAAFTRFRHA
jgi:hypothetical protein